MTDVLMIVIIGGFFLAAALLVPALGRVVADASEDWDPGGACRGGRECARRARRAGRDRGTRQILGPTFAAFLLGVIVIAGGLIYFPMLILGPIGERIVG